MTDLYRVRTVFSGVQGAPWLSTFFFRGSGGTAQQAATAVGNYWGAVDARMATTVSWAVESEVQTISDTTGQPVGSAAITPPTGGGGGAAAQLPVVAQGLLRLRTGSFLGGREVKGRCFIPGLTENDNDLGVPNASIVAVVDAAGAALVADANSILVVYSRANLTNVTVSSAAMAPYWSYLRTRRD